MLQHPVWPSLGMHRSLPAAHTDSRYMGAGLGTQRSSSGRRTGALDSPVFEEPSPAPAVGQQHDACVAARASSAQGADPCTATAPTPPSADARARVPALCTSTAPQSEQEGEAQARREANIKAMLCDDFELERKAVMPKYLKVRAQLSAMRLASASVHARCACSTAHGIASRFVTAAALDAAQATQLNENWQRTLCSDLMSAALAITACQCMLRSFLA